MTLIHTLCVAALLAASRAGAADLAIHVDDLKTRAGQLRVTLYDSAGAFMKTPAASASADVTGGANSVVIKDLPAGEYAFALYHDANSNGKMDKNLFGIPTEDYAFSNNATGKMGPPKYEQARFILPAAGASLRVSLH